MEQPFSFLASPSGLSSLPIVRETGTAINLGMQHVNAWTRYSGTAATVFTMGALPVDKPVSGIVEQSGSGTALITFSAVTVGGVTVVARGGTTIKTNAQYALAVWMYDPVARQYVISGDLTVT